MTEQEDEPLVLVTGAFDVVHIGHIRMLEYAQSLTKRGVIAMTDSDERIRNAKGQTRPFNCFRDRREFLLALKSVDWVLTIDTDEDIISTCKHFKPIRVVGGDWKDKPIVGGEFCREIKYFDRIPGYSTTKILENKDE